MLDSVQALLRKAGGAVLLALRRLGAGAPWLARTACCAWVEVTKSGEAAACVAVL